MKMKPCPFCGSEDVELHGAGPEGPQWIACDDCDASGPVAHSKEAALTVWNDRPQEKDRALRETR